MAKGKKNNIAHEVPVIPSGAELVKKSDEKKEKELKQPEEAKK